MWTCIKEKWPDSDTIIIVRTTDFNYKLVFVIQSDKDMTEDSLILEEYEDNESIGNGWEVEVDDILEWKYVE